MKQKRIARTETLIKNTNKRFPNCKAVTDEYGLWYIMDMYGEDTFQEFMIPHQESERLAWEMGKLTAHTIQNFNRTHPDKYIMEISSEGKVNRINKRKRKNNNENLNDFF